MDGQEAALFILVTLVLVVPISLGLALWIVTRLRRVSDQPLSVAPPRVLTVPVRQLWRKSRFFSQFKNSINPRLEIAPGGLRFKVFKPDHWPFAEIDQVDLVPAVFATRVEVRNHDRGRLYIDLANKERARDLLRALPPSVPLTQRALAMREHKQ